MTKPHPKFGSLTCGPWTKTNPPIIPIDGQNHNYCRNPNGLRRSPYCLTTKGIFGYCVIPECVSQLIEISDKFELYFNCLLYTSDAADE